MFTQFELGAIKAIYTVSIKGYISDLVQRLRVNYPLIKHLSHDLTCFVSGIRLVVHNVPIFVVSSKLQY